MAQRFKSADGPETETRMKASDEEDRAARMLRAIRFGKAVDDWVWRCHVTSRRDLTTTARRLGLSRSEVATIVHGRRLRNTTDEENTP